MAPSTGAGLLRQPPAAAFILHIAMIPLTAAAAAAPAGGGAVKGRSILVADPPTPSEFPPATAAGGPQIIGDGPCSDVCCTNDCFDAFSFGTSSTPTNMIIGIVALVTVLCLILFFCVLSRRTAKTGDALPCFDKDQANRGGESLQPSRIRTFLPEQLRKATRNYHHDNKLGRGAFGSVYKGTLHDGQEIAVKKLADPNQKHADSQFEAEVRTISSVRHRNLIRLLGYCVDGRNKYLIYEYLENQSLDKHLFAIKEQCVSMLSWNARRQIILGTANGLSYLHHDLHDRIIHRDIKAANILLDKTMQPKIADFGLARFFPCEQTHHSTMVAGTIGYLAPEVFKDGHVTQRSDTYSFGVVVLEILSGRRVIDSSLPSERRNLLDWAWVLYERDWHTDLMDPQVNGEYTEEEVNHLMWLALMCTQTLPERRPTMRDAVLFLERKKDRDEIGNPTRPEHVQFQL